MLNQVELRAGGPRDTSKRYDNAIAGCDGGRIELHGSTVTGFSRGGAINGGFAVYAVRGTIVTVDGGSLLVGNGVGVGLNGATASIVGASRIEGSVGNGVHVIGPSSALTLGGGSTVRGGGGDGLAFTGSAADVATVDISAADVSGNANRAALHDAARLRIRDTCCPATPRAASCSTSATAVPAATWGGVQPGRQRLRNPGRTWWRGVPDADPRGRQPWRRTSRAPTGRGATACPPARRCSRCPGR